MDQLTFLLFFTDSAKAANNKTVATPAIPVSTAPVPKVNGASIRDITNGVQRATISTPTKPPPAPVSVLEAPKAEQKQGDDEEISYEEAVRRREERELEEAKMLCSLENKEACLSTFSLDDAFFRATR